MSTLRVGPERRAVRRARGMQAGFLPCKPDPAFCAVHLPDGPPTGHGIVVCPPLAWSELCTHRVRRHWAQALAGAGHCALRLDLPGVGDSVGSPYHPGRVSSWIDAVATAARWLVDEAGCTRVSALGIGFGGMLGWLAAIDEPAIDDLILWDPTVSGRRVVREIRGVAALGILDDVPPELKSTAESWPVVDEAGQPVTETTMAELARLDLRSAPLPATRGMRVLLLARPDHPADAMLRSLLSHEPVELTVGDGSQLDGILQYVGSTITPDAAVRDSLRWLGDVRPEPADDSELHRPALPDSVSFEIDGVEVFERVVDLPLSTGRAQAIITEPVSRGSAGFTAIFVSASADRRIGPNRLWVETARRWAARGLTAVRVDPPGLGEATGDEHSWSDRWGIFTHAKVDEQRQIIRALRAEGVPSRMVLVGFCSGAFRILRAALQENDLAGVFLLAPPAFRLSVWTMLVRNHWIAAWRREPRHGRGKVAVARVLQSGLELSRRVQDAAIRVLQFRRSLPERVLGELAGRGTEVLLILRNGYWSTDQLRPARRRARLDAHANLRVETMPTDDTRFRPPAAQAWVQRELDTALNRVMTPREG